MQHLAREASNERRREADEPIRLDQFVKVDAQELHCDAKVAAEVEVFRHFDNVVLLIGVLDSRTKSVKDSPGY